MWGKLFLCKKVSPTPPSKNSIYRSPAEAASARHIKVFGEVRRRTFNEKVLPAIACAELQSNEYTITRESATFHGIIELETMLDSTASFKGPFFWGASRGVRPGIDCEKLFVPI
jgi:hypothetical protein